MGKRAHFLIELINPEAPASFRVFKGVARPMVDTVEVGHEAGAEFVRHFLHDSGVIENLPPHSGLVLVSDMLDQETASGIMQIDQTSGKNVWIRIIALQPGQEKRGRRRHRPRPKPAGAGAFVGHISSP